MKKLIFSLTVLMIILAGGCRDQGAKNRNKSEDLMTMRTLGLAYLEEFRLEDAEKQFLSFIKLQPGDKFGYANLGLTYLRMGNYDQAEKHLRKAIEIDSLDADIRLILATVYKMMDDPGKAVSELKKSLTFAPGHVKTLYEITEIFSVDPDTSVRNERRKYLHDMIEYSPGNLVPRLNLTEQLIMTGDSDGAMEQLEIIRKQFPEFPKESAGYYDSTIQMLREGNFKEALVRFTIFHNYLKVTPPYQAGMTDLKGPGGSLIGFPLITFDRQTSSLKSTGGSILENIKFTEITSAARLDALQEYNITHIETADYDSDGDIDIYAAGISGESAGHFLFSNNSGLFTEVTGEAGLNHSMAENSASFGDYDNDGFPDLYITGENGCILYRNIEKGEFGNVTGKSDLDRNHPAKMSLFFDADHDGDLDILETGEKILLNRNNADGTFLEQSEKMNISSEGGSDAAFADFDDDGDIDFFIAGNKNSLYSNQRQGRFRDIISECGIPAEEASGCVAISDFNNDGFPDLFLAAGDATGHLLMQNTGNGRFERVKKTGDLLNIEELRVNDAEFFDFDNDGFTDLLIAGETAEGEKRLLLFHNDGEDGFSNSSDLIPQGITGCNKIAVFDYNEDGDLDIAVARDGGISLLRNDGGNLNHFVRIRLVGLRAGSAKNNHFGIGAKIEMRAGDLYQTMVVKEPEIHFGTGAYSAADIIRITWTNGVPQNIFLPKADQALIEEQTLKGSCPFLYAWNGTEYEFVKDILWRSGLGMPMGIMGGNTTYAFADASDDYLKIPGEALKPSDKKYSIQVTSELWETIYLDKLNLVAADHPEHTDIYVEEQFAPPPFPGMKIFHVDKKIHPVSAIDSYGHDVLQKIIKKDDVFLSGYIQGPYQGITEMNDLVLDPGKISGKSLYLFMSGWIFPTDASINVALSQTKTVSVIPPLIQVLNKNGEWVTVTENTGFPMGKDKTVIVDLSGKFLSSDHRIRISTNMEVYWDEIFFTEELSEEPVVTTVLEPLSADLHYRGFSAGYRKGGRYGPHWFDYSVVSTDTKWRDLEGYYTRYGNVLPLLTDSDNKYIISNAGDEVTIEFNESDLPELKDGWKRDFLVYSVGWVKDGDLNTAFGNTVLPLPFHGMKSYPPSPADIYPEDPELTEYNMKYNTRKVSTEGFRNAIKQRIVTYHPAKGR